MPSELLPRAQVTHRRLAAPSSSSAASTSMSSSAATTRAGAARARSTRSATGPSPVASALMEERTAFRTCPFCEATCGLAVTVRGDAVVKVRGDAEDVFSHGFLCPKGVALKDLHEDPDRLRTPMVRGADGELRPASWEEAFAVVGDRLARLVEAHGRDAVAVYIGNPAAHG